MNSICIFAHFNKNNNLEDYVIDYIKTLKELVDEIIFVSTSDIETEKISLLKKITNKIIIKENVGYDFGSWREGLLFIRKNYKNLPNEIILCNDSCYISKDLFKDSISKMRKKRNIDFWGITTNYTLFKHIQSYFIAINSEPLKDKRLWDLFYKWGGEDSKVNYIINNEIGLSKFLLKQKYIMNSLIKLNILQLSFLTFKYKILFINDYLINIIKLIISKIFIKKIDEKVLKERKKNLLLKKTGLKRIFRIICHFANPINTDITYLDFNHLMKINSPFLKVATTKQLIKKEGLNNLKVFCSQKSFNYEHITDHQFKI